MEVVAAPTGSSPADAAAGAETPAPVTGVEALAGGASHDFRTLANAAMERYAAGDDGAFAILYDALAPRLHQFLMRHTKDKARADDLLQQTMLQMHCARGRFLPGADVTPWAFAIARRLVIDSFRRGSREVLGGEEARAQVPSGSLPADELLHSKRVMHDIERELERLPETQRVAFEMVKKDGLSLREAAQVLGTSVTAIKLRAHRAYAALRAKVADRAD